MGWRYARCAGLLARVLIERRLLQVRPAREIHVHAAGE
jgi:hypothetical protein